MNANITVLKDESLGGIEREYREVKRKAAVGDLVKSSVDTPPVFTVRNTGHGPGIVYGGADGLATFPDNYVVLEPSDTVRINSARFRMVDRKATVGERVIVTGERATFAIGKVFVVEVVDWACPAAGLRNGHNAIDGHYRVLEPVESAEPLSAKPAPDQAAEIIAKLTTRVASLERRVTLLEVTNAKPIPRRTTKPEQHPSFTKCAVKSPQEIRDDIVKRAKEDLNELSNGYGNYIFREPRTRIGHICEVEFVVNRDKRKVTAILRGVNSRKVYSVGRAVCSVGDVFNMHLGRAISLRKALNQPIPPEYFEVPNPTEARIGDYVKTYGSLKFTVTQEFSVHDVTRLMALGGASIIDDSRESDSAESREEVA